MKPLGPLSLIIVVGASVVGASSCTFFTSTATNPNQNADNPTQEDSSLVEGDDDEFRGVVITSADGDSQITVPRDWSEMDDLNEVAIIQAANLFEEQYAIVIQDNKEDFADTDINAHSEATVQILLDSLTSSEVTTPTPLTVNGYTAVQTEIQGSFENINVVYLHTSIETREHFYQVVTWTLKSRFESNRSLFEQVTQSFREIEA